MFARMQSGLPFTPTVQGDVNGDGRSGDRAFIPNPAAESDAVLAGQMRSLLADGSPSAKDCLLANLGRWTGIMSEISLRIVDPAWWQLLTTLPVLHDVTNHPWMLRVVDLPAAVAARGWPAAAYLNPCTVDLEVVDEHAPWHAGRHRLVVDSGKVMCEPGGSGTVRLTARALGPWFAGSADTSMLRRAGLLEADPADAQLLDLLTGAPRVPRMADSF